MRPQYLIDLPDVVVMALTVRAEAGGESELGQKGVAWVIRNRFDDKNPRNAWWKRQRGDGIPDDTIKAVCLDPFQFSCWNPDDKTYLGSFNPAILRSARFNRIKAICDAVIASTSPDDDPTDGSNHYCTTAVAHKTAWARNREPVVIIGNHQFYRI